MPFFQSTSSSSQCFGDGLGDVTKNVRHVLEFSDDLPIRFCAHAPPSVGIDGIVDETHGSVGQQSMDSAGVIAARRQVTGIEANIPDAVSQTRVRS